jgi:hypothetical protein
MKKRFNYLVLSIFIFSVSPRWNILNARDYYRNVLDSVQVFTYDSINSTWKFSGANHYINTNGLLIRILNFNKDHKVVAQSLNTYDDSDLMTETLSQFYADSTWLNNQLHFYSYDLSGKLQQRIVQKWNRAQWINLNKFSYYYGEKGQLTGYHRDIWRENEWIEYSIDTLIYNDQEQLIERYARKISDGSLITRVLYFYDGNGLRILQIRQNFVNSEWINISRDNYLYNACGYGTETISQLWIENRWVNNLKTLQFSHFQFTGENLPKKVPVCHNGHTIYISRNALKSHLAHGDCFGECKVDTRPERRCLEENHKPENPPFTVYPNPATEKITIEFEEDCKELQRIELVDFYGKLMKTYNVKEGRTLTIYREGYKSGKYYIRLIGKEIYSSVVIFE